MILKYMRNVGSSVENARPGTSPVEYEEQGCEGKGESFSAKPPEALPYSRQLLLPFEDEQLTVVRFPESAYCQDRRRSTLWREGKLLYTAFGSGGESA